MNNDDNKNTPQCQPLLIILILSFLTNMHFLLSWSMSIISAESFETVLDIMTMCHASPDHRTLSYLTTVS